jgi:hypothetical protein
LDLLSVIWLPRPGRLATKSLRAQRVGKHSLARLRGGVNPQGLSNLLVAPALLVPNGERLMSIPSRLTSALSAIAASAVLAGCSGAGMPGSRQLSSQGTTQAAGRVNNRRSALAPSRLQPTRRAATPVTAFVSPAIKNAGLERFFSDYVNNAVYILGARGTRLATLTGFANPSGLATDASRNLYVANEGAANILAYAPPYTGAPTTLNDPGQFPVDVAVDGHGNVAACNIGSPSFGSGSVTLYAAGSTNPTNTISSAALREVYFCAFDANGNLYLDGLDPTYSFFVAGEIVGGISGTSIATLTTSNTISYPGGVQVTTSGQIAFMDQGPGPAIYTYNPPISGSLGSPVATTPLAGANDPVTFAFDKGMRHVFTADAGLVSAIDYAYPAGGSPLRTHKLPRSGLPIGVATIPTEQY